MDGTHASYQTKTKQNKPKKHMLTHTKQNTHRNHTFRSHIIADIFSQLHNSIFHMAVQYSITQATYRETLWWENITLKSKVKGER